MKAALTKSRVVTTPYIVPFIFYRSNGARAFRARTAVNIGDGFILHGIERLIGKFDTSSIVSSRGKPHAKSLPLLESASEIILAGANQLSENLMPWAGFDLQRWKRRSAAKIVPFGVGIDGRDPSTLVLSEQAIELLTEIHRRTEFSSWRCPQTVAYLERQLPQLTGRLLMTGCPVLYDMPLLNSSRFDDNVRHIAVTITDRGNFWERESRTLKETAKMFPTSRKTLVIHQRFQPITILDKTAIGRVFALKVVNTQARIRRLARKLNFEIFEPRDYVQGIEFYKRVDLHIGSRLHAHLHSLSQNKRSFLTYVDERMTGMASYLRFPLCRPSELGNHMDFNFEVVRSAAIESHNVMQRFVRSI